MSDMVNFSEYVINNGYFYLESYTDSNTVMEDDDIMDMIVLGNTDMLKYFDTKDKVFKIDDKLTINLSNDHNDSISTFSNRQDYLEYKFEDKPINIENTEFTAYVIDRLRYEDYLRVSKNKYNITNEIELNTEDIEYLGEDDDLISYSILKSHHQDNDIFVKPFEFMIDENTFNEKVRNDNTVKGSIPYSITIYHNMETCAVLVSNNGIINSNEMCLIYKKGDD